MRHTQKRVPSLGVPDKKPGHRSTVVRLEDELHEVIRGRALRDGTSFGEQVRMLLEWGLESAGEAA